tara:strand:- start:138 stop:416 length:279 start_codon:yes stop_codon:yes gene_type:complete
MTKKPTVPPDTEKIRCPRLGHQIPFSYCRRENQGLPCFKTADCWHSHFPVVEYLRKELTPEQWKTVFMNRPKQKMLSLLDLIEQAKASKKGK